VPNFSWRAHAAAERVCEGLRERDRIALDRNVHVEAPFAEEDVPHGAADEVDAFERLGDRGDRFEDGLQPLQSPQLAGQHRAQPLRRRRLLAEGSQEVAAGDDAEDALAVHDRDALAAADEEALQLRQRRRSLRGGDA